MRVRGLYVMSTLGLSFLAGLLVVPQAGLAESAEAPSFQVRFLNTTQGPPWPPSEVVDEDGHFIAIGTILTEISPGRIEQVPGAALVSKDTVPPLDGNGRENFANPFGAPYQVIRPLKLSPGSPDLDTVLYTSSFGPAVGDFGGGPRIPKQGDSLYNLNMLPPICPERFPSESQSTTYTRERFPVHQAPIGDFQGDQVAYDVDTGEAFVPTSKTGGSCSQIFCPGEDVLNQRREQPVTLADWMKAKGAGRVTLTHFDPAQNAYTHARFNLRFSGLLPNSVYSIWALRQRTLVLGIGPSPLRMPNVLVTDDAGRGRVTYSVANPFSDPNGPDALLRLVGIAVAYHPDFQNWGGCAARFGAAVDTIGVLVAGADSGFVLTDLITKAPGN